MHHFPFLLQSCDHFFFLALVHEELLSVHFCLLFNLHLAYQLVLILDFFLDGLEVIWYLAVVFLLKEVSLIIGGQLRGLQYVLDSVRHDKVLV